MNFEIEKKIIGEGYPCYFIADIAANHDGDLEKAIDLIYMAAESGVDAVKFQHFQAHSIISKKGFNLLKDINSHQTSWTKSVYDVYKDASLPIQWTIKLREACNKAKIAFMTSPYSIELVDLTYDYVDALKIGSGDITWVELVRYIAEKGKPYMLATGASSWSDVVRAVDAGMSINAKLCLMQCNTNYTASLDNFKYINLNVLKTYRKFYPELVLGLSDHTIGFSTVLGAVTLGAKVIEKHFTDSRSREGPDHAFSVTPQEWMDMVTAIRELENSLGDGIKRVEDNERETSILQRRGVYAARALNKGEKISKKDLIMLRPAPEGAIYPYMVENLIGRELKRSITDGGMIEWSDII